MKKLLEELKCKISEINDIKKEICKSQKCNGCPLFYDCIDEDLDSCDAIDALIDKWK